MNIAIGKIGQKLIFDRNSAYAKRSNTNGNVGAYSFFELLIEKNKRDKFFIVGDCDTIEKYKNVEKYIDQHIDFGIFMVGVLDDEQFISVINKALFPYYIICDDPRCLESLNCNSRLKALPAKIFGQMNYDYEFKGKTYHINYMPVEYSLMYKQRLKKPTQKTKSQTLITIANHTSYYPRLEVVEELIKGTNSQVIGRLDKTKEYPSNFIGELEFFETQSKLESSLTSLIIPISEKCITSKYLEVIRSGVYPIFYKSYGYELIDKHIKHYSVVSTNDELLAILTILTMKNNHLISKIKQNQKFIKTLFSGKKLNKIIHKEIFDDLR